MGCEEIEAIEEREEKEDNEIAAIGSISSIGRILYFVYFFSFVSFFMSYRDLEPISQQLTIVVGLTVVGFMAFGLALSFYRNVLFENTLKNLQTSNENLHQEIDTQKQDLEYFRSAQYKDKHAKENLGKMNPGEKVLVITEKPQTPDFSTDISLTPTERQEAAFDEYLRQMPVLEHWKLYLFHREEIEALKRRL